MTCCAGTWLKNWMQSLYLLSKCYYCFWCTLLQHSSVACPMRMRGTVGPLCSTFVLDVHICPHTLLQYRHTECTDFLCIVISYRLAPEAHFPQQYYDALNAATFFLRAEVLAQYSVDPNRVAISGDSAGGNLAAAVVQQVQKELVCLTVLFYCHSI